MGYFFYVYECMYGYLFYGHVYVRMNVDTNEYCMYVCVRMHDYYLNVYCMNECVCSLKIPKWLLPLASGSSICNIHIKQFQL